MDKIRDLSAQGREKAKQAFNIGVKEDLRGYYPKNDSFKVKNNIVGSYKQGGVVCPSLKSTAKTLERKGRNGDTMLVHVNAREAAMLKAMGGRGTKNPKTGLKEYGEGQSKIAGQEIAPYQFPKFERNFFLNHQGDEKQKQALMKQLLPYYKDLEKPESQKTKLIPQENYKIGTRSPQEKEPVCSAFTADEMDRYMKHHHKDERYWDPNIEKKEKQNNPNEVTEINKKLPRGFVPFTYSGEKKWSDRTDLKNKLKSYRGEYEREKYEQERKKRKEEGQKEDNDPPYSPSHFLSDWGYNIDVPEKNKEAQFAFIKNKLDKNIPVAGGWDMEKAGRHAMMIAGYKDRSDPANVKYRNQKLKIRTSVAQKQKDLGNNKIVRAFIEHLQEKNKKSEVFSDRFFPHKISLYNPQKDEIEKLYGKKYSMGKIVNDDGTEFHRYAPNNVKTNTEHTFTWQGKDASPVESPEVSSIKPWPIMFKEEG